LLGAAVVIVGDLVPERLAQARSFGCETVDVSKDASVGDQIAQILKAPESTAPSIVWDSKPVVTAMTPRRKSLRRC
jgi:threonine dehydrogenase-like Zn-dependent dehydrogenase